MENSKSKKSKSGKKTKKRVCGGKRKSKRKKNKSKKTKRKSGKRKKSQSGGMMAEYPSSVSGAEGNFSADMATRQLGCRQPNWDANCV